MKKFIFILFFFTNLAYADADLDNYLDESIDIDLDRSEAATLNTLKHMQKKRLQGYASAPHKVIFTFGLDQPTIVCRVLEICDISLEAGEKIRDVSLGDTARWDIDTATSGQGATLTEHLVVKPFDTGLNTSMMVTTNRRTYHLRLKSSANDFMPAVSFNYPQNLKEKLKKGPYEQYYEDEVDDLSYASEENSHESDYKVHITNPHKNKDKYEITGDMMICPKKVWNDGKRTFIDIPKNNLGKLPVLLAVESSNYIFQEDKLHELNYRILGNTYVVDGVFEHARLIYGSDDRELTSDIVLKS